MRIVIATIAVLFWSVALTFAQGLGPCTSKTLDGVPCLDPNFGVVVRFKPPIPTEKLAPQPQQVPPLDTGKAEAPIEQQSQAFNQKSSSTPHYNQYWTYGKGGSCEFHEGNNVQRFDASTVQSYAASRAQFDESWQTGQEVGGAIGAIVHAWVAHHRRIAAERKNLRQQINNYYNTTFDLIDENMREQDTLAADFTLLAKLDPPRRDIYERGVKNAALSKARFATMRPAGEKMLHQILATKKVKYLRKDVPMAQKTYEAARNYAEREYVFVRFVGGLAGYFASRQMATPVSSQETSNSR